MFRRGKYRHPWNREIVECQLQSASKNESLRCFCLLIWSNDSEGFHQAGEGSSLFPHTLPGSCKRRSRSVQAVESPNWLRSSPLQAGQCALCTFVNGCDPLSPVQEVALTARYCSVSKYPFSPLPPSAHRTYLWRCRFKQRVQRRGEGSLISLGVAGEGCEERDCRSPSLLSARAGV